MKITAKSSLKRQGFSLVEIVIAVAVIGIMSAAIFPVIKTTMDKSRKSRAGSELEGFRDAAVSLYSDTEFVPYRIDCTGAGAFVDGDALDNAGNQIAGAPRILVTVSAAAGAGEDLGTGAAALTASSLVDNTGGTLPATIEDMDAHLGEEEGAVNTTCARGARRYDTANRDLYWKGPYLTPKNRVDPWGVGYALFAPTTINLGATNGTQSLSFSTARPGWFISAGQDEGFVDTSFDGTNAVTFNPEDIGIRLVLR